MTRAGIGVCYTASDAYDSDPGHGKYFQRLATAINKRTTAELRFEVL